MTFAAAGSRFAGLPGAIRGLLLVTTGGLAALGQPPLGYWSATLVAILALFTVLDAARTARQAGWQLWLFGLGYFAFALRWLVEPFQVEAEIFGWMAPFALFFMAAGLSLFWAVAGWVGHRFGGGLVIAIALGLAELARGYVLTGFPWAGLAQIWVGTPVAQSLSFIGPQGLGFLTFLTPAFLASGGRALWVRAASSAAIVAVLLVPGLLVMAEEPSNTDGRPVVRVVQPNAPQHEKWDREKAPVFFDRQIASTRAGDAPDLVVWPETAIPELLRHTSEHLAIAGDAARGATLVMGLLRTDDVAYFNSLVVVENGAPAATRDKHHLVPFGEYMPMAWFFSRLGIRGLAQQAASGFASGPGPILVEVAGLKALPLICYEAVFPQHARISGERPDLLLQITNDAWFGTYAGPQQHLAQARMRAIEQGLPLVRSANTGISAIVDARGRIVTQLGMDQHGYVEAPLPKPRAMTLYGRFADVPVMAVLLLMAGIAAFGNRTRR